jgi:hypothetical protein
MRTTRSNFLLSLAGGALASLITACGTQPGSMTAAVPEAPPASRATMNSHPSARNMQLVGLHELQGRSAYMPLVHAYNDRRVLFVGHHRGEALNALTGRTELNGLSILDVTNPAEPVLLSHLPPTGAALFTQHVQVCDGSMLPNAANDRVYAIRTNGNLGYEVIDVTDPANPFFVTTIAETGTSSRPESDRGNRETHKFQWECDTGIAWLNGTADAWRVTRLLQVFDVSDPRNPTHIRDFGLQGWEPGAEGPFPQPGVAGLHQPTVVGDRVFLGYNSGADGVLQILDRDRMLDGSAGAEQPFAPTPENLNYPEISRIDFPSYYGAHTAKPLYDFAIPDYSDNRDNTKMDILLAVSESGTFRCQENRDVMFIMDITEEDRPFPIATFQVPEEPGDFCHRGGRFGPHSFHDAWHPAFDHSLVLLAWFNAGIRAVDIRNPFAPVEVGYFIPQVNDNTSSSCIEIDGTRECDVAIQTNNVDIDDRGFIYAVDRASSGLHILELTGDAAAIVN